MHLTPTEWGCWRSWCAPAALVSRSELLSEVWGPAYATETHYLRVYLAQLRRKLEPDPSHPRHLVTEPGWATASRCSRVAPCRLRSRPRRMAGFGVWLIRLPLAPPRQPAASTELWVERTGTRRYTGAQLSGRGGADRLGERRRRVHARPSCLKIALAACTGMSSDMPLSRRLGDNYDATVRVSGAADRENEVYPRLDEVLEVDLSELDAEAQERLLTVVLESVDKVCTVGRTLKTGTVVNLTVETDS